MNHNLVLAIMSWSSALTYAVLGFLLVVFVTSHLSTLLVSFSLAPPTLSYYPRLLASFTALFLCAIYGTCASGALSLFGHGELGQYTTARAFKWTMLVFTGVWMVVEDPGVGKEGYGEKGWLGTRPAVFVGNHQSELDVLVVGHVFMPGTVVTAKSSLKYVPVLGWFMLLSKTVFLDRKNATQASGALGSAGQQMKKNRQSVFMFAEGTRSYFDHPDLLPFKSGAFRLAVQAGVPVVPVVVEPYSNLLNSKKKIFRTGTIRIKVLKPIETVSMSSEFEAVRKFTDETREIMLRELKGMAEAAEKRGVALKPHEAMGMNGTTGKSSGLDVGVAGLEHRSVDTLGSLTEVVLYHAYFANATANPRLLLSVRQTSSADLQQLTVTSASSSGALDSSAAVQAEPVHFVSWNRIDMADPAHKKQLVLITGATGGIGKATALAFAKTGLYDLALHYHSASTETRSQLADEIKAANPTGTDIEITFFQADLGSFDDVRRLHAEVTKQSRDVDILFNNAGSTLSHSGVKSLADVSIDVFEQSWRVNTGCGVLLTQLCLPHMERTGCGRVIFCSSVAGLTGGVVGSHYASSKSAIHGFVHWLAGNVAKKGITVNAIAPTLIEETAMLPGGSEELASKLPVGRLGKPDEIADTVMWMVRNGYVTNKVIAVDGGMYPH
nr:hypothetical protein B0A51_02000 [Rachicladosporium sp. CCFEE 5018]